MQITVEIPEKLYRTIDTQVQSGRYSDASDVVRDALPAAMQLPGLAFDVFDLDWQHPPGLQRDGRRQNVHAGIVGPIPST
jgi:hypothetical protein